MILIAESPSRRTEYRRYLGNAGLNISVVIGTTFSTSRSSTDLIYPIDGNDRSPERRDVDVKGGRRASGVGDRGERMKRPVIGEPVGSRARLRALTSDMSFMCALRDGCGKGSAPPGGVPDGVLSMADGQWTRRRNSGISSGSSPGSWPLTGSTVCTITLGPIPPVNSARRENPGLSG